MAFLWFSYGFPLVSQFHEQFQGRPSYGRALEATYMKMARLPQGPTLTFRVDSRLVVTGERRDWISARDLMVSARASSEKICNIISLAFSHAGSGRLCY